MKKNRAKKWMSFFMAIGALKRGKTKNSHKWRLIHPFSWLFLLFFTIVAFFVCTFTYDRFQDEMAILGDHICLI